MAKAKDIRVAPISAKDARDVVKRFHYSGKYVKNSQLHFGCFLGGRLEGAMQFGPSLDKRKTQRLVSGTSWNGFIELNRMAFSEKLPRNSESRALSVAFRLIREHYPHIEWIISFADGTQSGDGAIYRASGFVLTQIKKNNQMWCSPENTIFSRMSLTDQKSRHVKNRAREIVSRTTVKKGAHSHKTGASSMKAYKEAGWVPLEGFQLRYVYFINKEALGRLTCDTIPFSRIHEMGASMYRGKKTKRPKQAMTGDHPAQRRCDTDRDAPNSAGADGSNR